MSQNKYVSVIEKGGEGVDGSGDGLIFWSRSSQIGVYWLVYPKFDPNQKDQLT